MKGKIPADLPASLMIGLQERAEVSWMRNSGVPWNARYRYLVKGWHNNWGYDPTPDGSWARGYMDSCPAGMIPTFQYYCVRGEPGGGDGVFLPKLQNANTMRQYFTEFRDLMRRAKEYGKPVMVLVEADGFAYLEQQAQHNPNTAAAVASTGLPELAAMPNSVTGWMRAFRAIRDAVGATKVILGIHVSTWATGVDVMHGAGMNAPLQPEVDRAYAFLSGAMDAYDVLVGDPCDRDAWYHGGDRIWGPAQFARYAEWLRLWNEKAGKRWVLWQIPEGNSGQLNVNNSGQVGGGWRDNRSEYWLGANAVHRKLLADNGVIALLFGAGATGQSTHETDRNVIRDSARAFFLQGGMPLPRDPASTSPVLPPVFTFDPALVQPTGNENTTKIDLKLTNAGAAYKGGSVKLKVGSWERSEAIGPKLTGEVVTVPFVVPLTVAGQFPVIGTISETGSTAVQTFTLRDLFARWQTGWV